MVSLDRTKYNLLMKHLNDHALALNKHEIEFANEYPDKRPKLLHNIVQTNFPLTQCCNYKNEGFVLCFNNRFYHTIQLYEFAFKEKPKAFQNGDAIDILKTLYEKSNYWSSFDDYIDYLRTEACCYIVLTKEDTFGEILRVDLYRKLDLDKKSKRIEFTGGLFHCLKHFSMNGINLCNGSDINDTFDIMHVAYLIGRTFSFAIKNNSEIGIIDIDKSHLFKANFYFEECSAVFFIKTLRIGKPEKVESDM